MKKDSKLNDDLDSNSKFYSKNIFSDLQFYDFPPGLFFVEKKLNKLPEISENKNAEITENKKATNLIQLKNEINFNNVLNDLYKLKIY